MRSQGNVIPGKFCRVTLLQTWKALDPCVELHAPSPLPPTPTRALIFPTEGDEAGLKGAQA